MAERMRNATGASLRVEGRVDAEVSSYFSWVSIFLEVGAL